MACPSNRSDAGSGPQSRSRPAAGPFRPAVKAPPTSPTAQDYPMPPLPRAKVVLHDAYGGAHPVDVEVCATEAARNRGMMWRTELAAGKGMLFIFAEEVEHAFWMSNTLIPLDMVFITAGKKVVGIVENAEPQTLKSRTVHKPSTYVLEVPGGWTAKKGIVAGSAVELQDLAALPVEH
jgi:uncharacterized protein